MKRKKLSDLKVGMQVRTSPPAKRLELGEIEQPTPDLVWTIRKNDGEKIVLFNEFYSAGPLTLPKDHAHIKAFHDDPNGTSGILALHCQITIKLTKVTCPLIRRFGREDLSLRVGSREGTSGPEPRSLRPRSSPETEP